MTAPRLTLTSVPPSVGITALQEALAGLGIYLGNGDILHIGIDQRAVDVALAVRYPDGSPMVNDEGAPAIHRIVVPIVDDHPLTAPAGRHHHGTDPADIPSERLPWSTDPASTAAIPFPTSGADV